MGVCDFLLPDYLTDHGLWRSQHHDDLYLLLISGGQPACKLRADLHDGLCHADEHFHRCALYQWHRQPHYQCSRLWRHRRIDHEQLIAHG